MVANRDSTRSAYSAVSVGARSSVGSGMVMVGRVTASCVSPSVVSSTGVLKQAVRLRSRVKASMAATAEPKRRAAFGCFFMIFPPFGVYGKWERGPCGYGLR